MKNYLKIMKFMLIQNIDLHIKSGETIGIIGGTGSSKSSLVNLISRLYDVSEGSVFVGGKDVRSYDIETLRNEVAMVLQKNTLFSGTIKENLMWGNENATDAEIEAAASSACVDEFIDRLPGRYDMHLEQGGVNVSGGQKQRCACARALINKPKLILADEPTGALDSKSSRMLLETMEEMNEKLKATILMVTHDSFSASFCGRVLFLKDGKIFNEIIKGEKTRKEFFNEILDMLTLLGGDVGNVK